MTPARLGDRRPATRLGTYLNPIVLEGSQCLVDRRSRSHEWAQTIPVSTRVSRCPPRRAESTLHIAVEGGLEDEKQHEPEPAVDRRLRVDALSYLDPLKRRHRRPDRRHDDQCSWEKREYGLRRAVAEVFRVTCPAVVGHLTVDEVPPEQHVDPQGHDRKNRDRDRTPDLRGRAGCNCYVIRRRQGRSTGSGWIRRGRGGHLGS